MPAWKRVDCRLAITDSPVGTQPERATCPSHQDPTASLMVYGDGCYCFGCKFRLGRMETLAFLLYGGWAREQLDRAFAAAEKYTSDAVDAYRQRVEESVKKDPLPYGLANAYWKLLQQHRRPRMRWLLDRGLTEETIDVWGLGHDGTRFTLPVLDHAGKLLTIRFRRDDFYGTTQFDPKRGEDRPIPKYSGMPGRNGLFLFGAYPLVDTETDWAVVVEGELDAVRLWQEGIPAVSPTNGAGNVPRVPALLKRDYPLVTRLFFATDQDEPGQTAAIEGYAAARREGFSATRLTWDEQAGKDVTEFYLGGHTLKDAIYDGDDLALPTPA